MLDNLDVRILAHLQENSRKSFRSIAKQCLTSVPTVKSRVERLKKLGVIRRFTIDIDHSMLDIPEAIVLVDAQPNEINRVAEEFQKLEEVKELYVTSDSSIAIVCRVSGDMQQLLSIREKIDLKGVKSLRIIPVKRTYIRDGLPLTSSSIAVTCIYCGKKITQGVVRKKLNGKDYFFCCNTCLREFEKRL